MANRSRKLSMARKPIPTHGGRNGRRQNSSSAIRAGSPLILQKSGGLQDSFAYLADCADPGGGCVFVMKEFGSGGFTAAVAATNGADRSTRTTLREALSVGMGFGSLIDRSIGVTSA
jgi:hypothetical protein